MAKILSGVTMIVEIDDKGTAQSITFNYSVGMDDDPKMRKAGQFEVESPNFSSGIRTVINNILPQIKESEGVPTK